MADNILTRVAPSARPMGGQNMLADYAAAPPPSPVGSRDLREYGHNILAQMAGDAPAGSAANILMGFAASPAAIRAFHGSPHRFDRFDMSRIGTGEGAQAYGHGLYFAGSEDVARGYRDRLAPPPPVSQRVSIDGRSFADLFPGDIPARGPAAVQVDAHGGNIDEAIAVLRARGSGLSARSADLLEPYRGGVASIEPVRPAGHMYEVNLRTDPGRLLDWDAPLAQQPQAVRDAISETMEFRGRQRDVLRQTPDAAGRHAYMALQEFAQPTGGNLYGDSSRGARFAAEELRNAGVQGIQYLDGGSRSAGQGTRNYVMFDDGLVDILRRYAVPGMVGGGAAAASGRE